MCWWGSHNLALQTASSHQRQTCITCWWTTTFWHLIYLSFSLARTYWNVYRNATNLNTKLSGIYVCTCTHTAYKTLQIPGLNIWFGTCMQYTSEYSTASNTSPVFTLRQDTGFYDTAEKAESYLLFSFLSDHFHTLLEGLVIGFIHPATLEQHTHHDR